MTAKTITLALAATTAAAALADVVEVKFTVKTKVEGQEKVANKVISGLYDDETDRHVFWTVVNVQTNVKNKIKTVKVNQAYTGTFFGPSNDTLLNNGKTAGANVELIWGTADDPENVLVAGGWGKATSLSGQVAGMIDKIPANGSWSAKVNTKKTFEQLLESNKVVGYDFDSIRKDGVIDDIKANAADAIAKAQKALDEAEETVAEKQDELDKAIADKNATAEELEAKKTELSKAQDDLKTAETDLKNAIAAANAASNTITSLTADLAATNAVLAAAEKNLADAESEMAVLVQSLDELNDDSAVKMISTFLDDTAKTAQVVKDYSAGITNGVWAAFDAYTNSLDLSSYELAITNAQLVVDEKQDEKDAADALVTALTATNEIVNAIKVGNLDTFYGEKIETAGKAVTNKMNEIKAAETSFDSYTNRLTILVNAYSSLTSKLQGEANDLWDAYLVASNNVAEAQTLVDDFDPASVKVMTKEEFRIYQATNDVAKVTYDDSDGKSLEKLDSDWEAYKAKARNDAKDALDKDLTNKQDTAQSAYSTWQIKDKTYRENKAFLEKYDVALKNAIADHEIEGGVIKDMSATEIAKLREELEELEKEYADIQDEYNYWKTIPEVPNPEIVEAQLTEAKEAQTAAEPALETAKQNLETANTNKTDAVSNQTNKLQALATLITGVNTGLDDLAGKVDEILVKVEDFVAKYEAKIADAEKTLAAVANVKAKMGLE